MPARVLVAPDSFKGTFSAPEVAAAIAAGLSAAGCRPDPCPVADGGEGTMDVLVEALGGRVVTRPATDPLGRPLKARVGLLGRDAIVEVAQASGLTLLAEDELDPERASSAGTGELIVAARELAAERILVAAGGSATVDAGAGAVAAISAGGGLEGRRLTVLCDVTTSFERAAAVYGPQKGASPEAVTRLAARLEAEADAMPRDPRGRPWTGAAGGLAGGLWAHLDAELVAGADFVLDAVGLDRRLRAADAAIVGEGSLDAQSAEGKIVARVAARCRQAGVPAYAIAGRVRLSAEESAALGLAGVSTASTGEQLVAAARELGAALET